MRIPRRLHIVAYGMPALVAAIFVAAERLPHFVPDEMKISALWACFAAASAVTAAASYLLAARAAKPRDAARIALAPVMLAASSFALFIYVDSDLSRILTAVAAVGLLGAHSAFVAGLHAPARYKRDDLKHIALAVRVVASFCALVYAFALPVITQVPPYAAAAAVSAWIALAAWEALHDEDFSVRPPLIMAALFAVLGAEFYASLSVLPLTPYVDAAVGLSLFATALSTATLALRGAAPPRRNFYLAAALVAALLVSARWY